MDLLSMFPEGWLLALGQVLMIDVVLAGDNAIVIGLAAARIPADKRKKVILLGLIAAVGLRIALSLVAVQLLAIIGLLLAGGILLLWVCWRMWRDISHDKAHIIPEVETGASVNKAIVQILIADVSMSLDNVLAVAGAARHHWDVLIIGLLLSIALMGAAATYIARLLEKYRWISYIGLIIVLYVALKMIYDGGLEVWGALG
ncbi:MAG TPA: YjbE family putative metal transport protein [Rhizomicrobium sp.]|nr:YjbE family putative metal transport protein [Rhizomicrobium sp.]